MAKDRMDREERKQLRGPDEFVTTATSFVEWVQANMRAVIAVTVTIVAVFLAFGVFVTYQNAQHREANADLAGGLDAFRGGEYSEAATALETLSERSGTGIGPIAALVAADSQLRAGEADAAITTLSAVDDSALPDYLRQQVQLAWANALESKGDFDAAAAKYAAAAATTGPYTADALVGQARVRGRNGDAADAVDIYRKVLEDFPERNDRQFLESQAG